MFDYKENLPKVLLGSLALAMFKFEIRFLLEEHQMC